MPEKTPVTYRDAGVDIDAGNALVERIRPAVASTKRPGVLGGLGGFGGLFEIPPGRFEQPVLVSATDGVGTKLRLAIQLGRHEGIGIDLVAMCANDVIVQGAEPLFFLDYFATARLDVDVAAQVVESIANGCRQAGAALIGGETAEMPGMYAPGDYDLAGFCVGAVEKTRILDGSTVAPGDKVIGLRSSGPHANGYSLIRHLLARDESALDTDLNGVPLADALLEPTRIYVKPLLELLTHVPVRALAHITGGGLTENLPRVLPPGTAVRLSASAWQRPPVFDWLARAGNIQAGEMYRTFNCGVGMVAIVAPEAVEASLNILHAEGETAWPIGEIRTGNGGVEIGA